MSRELLEPASISALERQLLIAGGASSQSKPKIQPVGTSPLLSQLKQFLPKMEQANAELQQKLQECDPAELDIEHIPEQEEEGPVIQMDLACGLLELHDDAAVAAAQRAIAAGGEVTVETYDGGTDSDSDSDSDGDSSDGSSSCSDDSDDDADVAADDIAAGSSKGCLRGAAAASNTAAAAAAGDAGPDAMEEDEAEELEVEASADGVAEQQQQQKGKQRRKLKPKRPMIVEL